MIGGLGDVGQPPPKDRVSLVKEKNRAVLFSGSKCSHDVFGCVSDVLRFDLGVIHL